MNKLSRQILVYVAIVLGTIATFEIAAFAILAVRTASNNGTSILTVSNSLVSGHPWVSKSSAIPFGFYDPVVTQRFKAFEPHGALQFGEHGYLHNGHDDAELNTFPRKPDNIIRIILLGGSSMAGNALRSDNTQTIAAYLERSLNKSDLVIQSGKKFQVLNWGYSGAYSFTELVRFFSDGVHVEPDMVIMLDGWNDTIRTSFDHKRMDLPHPLLNWGSLHYQYFDRVFGLGGGISAPAFLTYSALLYEDMTGSKTVQDQRLAVYKTNPVFSFSESLLKQDPGLTSVMLKNWSAVASWTAVSNVRFVAYLQPFAGYFRAAAPIAEKEMLNERLRQLAEQYGPEWAPNSYFQAMQKSFEAYAYGLDGLNQQFAGTTSRFVDLRAIFDDEPEQVYLDTIHYNEHGNKLLADRMEIDVERFITEAYK